MGYELTDQVSAGKRPTTPWAGTSSSAVPGSPGNTVMSGHNATCGSRVFRDLHRIEIGAAITVTANGTEHDYVVTDRIVLPFVFASEYRRGQIRALLGQFGDERLTLITCYPWFRIPTA